MPEQELQALALDIEKHGQREPGVMFEGKVLDGWHRYLACQAANVKFKTEEYEGDDPISFVISRNLHRRHLTAAQRVAAVAECAKWAPAHRPEKGGTGSPVMTNRQIAEVADASEKTVKQVKAGIRAGLGEAIKEGMVSAKDAAAIASGKPEKSAAAPKPSGDAAKLQARIKELEEALSDSEEKREAAADVARELNDKLEAFETTELDAQQKLIADLQLKLRKRDAEIDRLRMQIRDANNKNNELIRQVKILQRKNGR